MPGVQSKAPDSFSLDLRVERCSGSAWEGRGSKSLPPLDFEDLRPEEGIFNVVEFLCFVSVWRERHVAIKRLEWLDGILIATSAGRCVPC